MGSYGPRPWNSARTSDLLEDNDGMNLSLVMTMTAANTR